MGDFATGEGLTVRFAAGFACSEDEFGRGESMPAALSFFAQYRTNYSWPQRGLHCRTTNILSVRRRSRANTCILEITMNDTNQEPKARDALVDNIAHRDVLPIGWRRIYDQLVADLYKLDPDLRVSQAKEKLGELRIHLHQSGGAEVHACIAEARKSTRTACEVCGQSARGYWLSDIFHRLCEPHLRTALATDAACGQLFGDNQNHADSWMHSYSSHLGETAATRAARSADGLEEVLEMIGRISAGVYF